MKFKARIKAILYALLAVVFVTACVVSLYFYTAKQRKSLWRQLVMNVMEVTEQGGHSFEVYLNEKLEWWAGSKRVFLISIRTTAQR